MQGLFVFIIRQRFEGYRICIRLFLLFQDLFVCSFCLDAKRTKRSKRFVRKSLKRHSLIHGCFKVINDI